MDFLLHFVTKDYLWHQVTLANALGLFGGAFWVATYAMRTMIPLRVAGIISTAFFLGYGIISEQMFGETAFVSLTAVAPRRWSAWAAAKFSR
jgi:hypothetical protein